MLLAMSVDLFQNTNSNAHTDSMFIGEICCYERSAIYYGFNKTKPYDWKALENIREFTNILSTCLATT